MGSDEKAACKIAKAKSKKQRRGKIRKCADGI
jgi:hypothetical protein